jgi:hypothetical protein
MLIPGLRDRYYSSRDLSVDQLCNRAMVVIEALTSVTAAV